MKKITAILLVAVLVLSMAACGGSKTTTSAPAASTSTASTETKTEAPKAEDKGQTWSLNAGCIANDPATVTKFNAMGAGLQMFADLAREYTDGRVDITIHYASVLGGNVPMYEEVMNGTLDFHFGQPMSSIDSRYACWSLPYMFTDFDHVARACAREGGPVYALADEWSNENGVKVLSMGCGAFRGFVSNGEVRVPADAKNFKIRTYEDKLVNTFWGKIGTASIVPGSEIYSALQTKTVDAMEFHPTGCMSFKLYEVADHFAVINWQWTAGSVLSCNLDLWESFPADIQEALYKAADEATTFMLEQEVADDNAVFAVMEENGMTVVELTEEEHAEWVAVADSMVDWMKDFIGADVYDEYVAAVEATR